MVSTYPDQTCFKSTDGTSEAAAITIAPTVPSLGLIALRGLAKRGAVTPLEVVAIAASKSDAIGSLIEAIKPTNAPVEPAHHERLKVESFEHISVPIARIMEHLAKQARGGE